MEKLREETVPCNNAWAAELKKEQILRISGTTVALSACPDLAVGGKPVQATLFRA